MEDADTSMAQDALRSIPLFAGRDLQKARISRLGGLTNLVFRLDLDGKSYCLRIPGKGTEEYINRADEERAAREAARAGVSPDVLYFDAGTGRMVTAFLSDTLTMSPQHFKSRKGAPARAALAFRRLHRSGAVFPFRFELFSMIDGYLKVLAEKEVDFPAGYHDVLKEAETVRAALAANPLPVVACHCDPLAENFLDTGERMWIVDWEYSGMNDPMWDLGDLSVEATFDPDQEREMIHAYFGGAPSPAETGRIVIYKAMCDLLWTLWGLIQHANRNPADDFWSYALNRFRRCKDLMADPAFTRHVDAVRHGPRTPLD
jgi:thiamine kinase-like enzyme